MKPKKFVAALVALSLVFCLVPARAFAYVDYSGDQALTQVSAVYQFLKEYGGASDLPDVDDTAAAEFYANILGQTATPFYSFLYNYSYYAIFSGWRVYQASDFAGDDDAQWRYQESMDAAVEYLQNEWAAWVEEYPAAGGGGGGGGSSSGSTDRIYYQILDMLLSQYVIDGHTFKYIQSDIDNFARGNSCAISSGSTSVNTYAYVTDGVFALDTTQSSNKFSLFYLTNSQTVSRYVRNTGQLTTKTVQASSSYPVIAGLGYSYADSLGSFGATASTPALITTNGSFFLDGDLIELSGPAPEGPTGPTAPDYETPEPFQPVNPTLPNITNNITNNPSNYTGSETDYSDYLKIIIDNQKQQIQQLHDLGELIDREWDGFNSWLNSELDNMTGYLTNFQQFWNTLLEYQKSANGYLYSIDQQILMLRNRLSNDANMLWGLLRDIYYKIPSDGGGTLPDVTIDDGNGGGFLNWLYDLIEQAVDLLVGGSAELTGMLDDLRQLTGVFPFSLPWDLIAVLTVLQHEPVGDLTLQYPIIDGVAEGGGVSWTWHELDLTFAQPLIVACNFGFFGLALLGLIHATKDMFDMVNKVVG